MSLSQGTLPYSTEHDGSGFGPIFLLFTYCMIHSKDMCRMLCAYLPREEYDRVHLTRSFLKLAEEGLVPRYLSPGHHDGWGMAQYRKGDLVGWYRSQDSGATDAKRELIIGAMQGEPPDTLLVHVRKISVGEPAERNSHPFISGKFSFIHNGTLGQPDQEVFKEVEGRAVGETDTERYFHLVIRDLGVEDELSPHRVASEIMRTISAIRVGASHDGGGYSSASSVLCDGKYAYALREYDENHPSVRKHLSHEYYTLFIGFGDGGERIVCSEQLSIPGIVWKAMENHTLAIIDLSSGDVSYVTVGI